MSRGVSLCCLPLRLRVLSTASTAALLCWRARIVCGVVGVPLLIVTFRLAVLVPGVNLPADGVRFGREDLGNWSSLEGSEADGLVISTAS